MRIRVSSTANRDTNTPTVGAPALPEKNAEQARVVGERLRVTFERRDFAHTWRTGDAFSTVSIGVATRVPGERDLEAILKRADQALYKAKGNGRNRVETE